MHAQEWWSRVKIIFMFIYIHYYNPWKLRNSIPRVIKEIFSIIKIEESGKIINTQ